MQRRPPKVEIPHESPEWKSEGREPKKETAAETQEKLQKLEAALASPEVKEIVRAKLQITLPTDEALVALARNIEQEKPEISHYEDILGKAA